MAPGGAVDEVLAGGVEIERRRGREAVVVGGAAGAAEPVGRWRSRDWRLPAVFSGSRPLRPMTMKAKRGL